MTNSPKKLNSRDINEKSKLLRNDLTILNHHAKTNKIAVLELSTKAVKLLYGDQELIKQKGFDFNYFERSSILTDTGSAINSDGVVDLNYIIQIILPAIKKMLQTATENNVSNLFSVATAAYRSAKNRTEVLMLIKETCGVNVRILSKKEESIGTLRAFLFSKPNNVRFIANNSYLLIDQGGGSTEITIFNNNELVEAFSLNIGSTTIRNAFFNVKKKFTFNEAFIASEKLIETKLKPFFKNYKQANSGNFCIGVGSAIIHATGGKTAYQKHGVVLTVQQLKQRLLEFDNYIRTNYNSIADLYKALEYDKLEQLNSKFKHDQVDNYLVARLALPVFIAIMERFNIEKVVVSNTGLFYGIYFEHLFQEK